MRFGYREFSRGWLATAARSRPQSGGTLDWDLLLESSRQQFGSPALRRAPEGLCDGESKILLLPNFDNGSFATKLTSAGLANGVRSFSEIIGVQRFQL